MPVEHEPGAPRRGAPSDPALELQAVRTTLEAGSPAQAISMGASLLPLLSDPTDQATLHLLMGRAELLNGRLGPAVQRFRLADRVGDGLQMGIWEAFSQYGAGGLEAVEHVVNEVEATANGDGLTLASVSGIRAWLHIERGQAAAGLALAKTANEQALAVGLPDLVALSWLVLALAHATAGDVASGARSIATGIELGEQTGHAIAAPLFHMVAADLHHWRGNLGDVFHHAGAALSRSEPITGGLVGVWAHGQLSVAADRRGELELAADHLRSAEAALLRGVPLGWAHLAIARLRADRTGAPECAALNWTPRDSRSGTGGPTRRVLPNAARVGSVRTFASELLATLLLVGVYLATENRNRLTRPLLARLSVVLAAAIIRRSTTLGINPARSLGAAIWDRFGSTTWIFIVAPLLAGVIGATATRTIARVRERMALSHADASSTTARDLVGSTFAQFIGAFVVTFLGYAALRSQGGVVSWIVAAGGPIAVAIAASVLFDATTFFQPTITVALGLGSTAG